MNRRSFLHTFAAAAGGSLFTFGGLVNRANIFAQTDNLEQFRSAGFGELIPTAAKSTGETFLALPKGFEYKAFGKFSTVMSDGRPTPAAHDGMATFKIGNELRIVRNHEVSNKGIPIENSGIGIANHYDETAGGGTTTLVINPKTNELLRDFVSLSGTLVNCSGGTTPWNSWISCEETTLGQSIRTNEKTGKKTGGFAKPHGYCFEVFASANSNTTPIPLKAMGRFVHEGIGVDPKTGIVYLTEDAGKSGFYRFLPNRNKRLADGGILQMLKIKDKDAFDTRNGLKIGQTFTANWVTIDNPDPESADINEAAVYEQGVAKGAATFARLEGIFPDKKGRMYFVSSSGGDNKGGQIWLYERENKEEGKLTLVFESPSRLILDMPDNICLKPKSDLIFLCEDSDYVGEGGTTDNFIRILSPNGKIADFAKNIVPGLQSTEFAGSTFSSDGKTLFVSLQVVGVTFAIWGDWGSFKA